LFTFLISAEEPGFTAHPGEFAALILLATIGMMFLASTEELLMIFVSLELASLGLYILTAMDKRRPNASEAALKYFLFGGMSAAVTLYGISLIYGITGSTHLREIASLLGNTSWNPLLLLALVMVAAGFGFKIAAVPFHLWSPDAYEGAPVGSAALIASGSKLASFFILAKLMDVGFGTVAGEGAWKSWTPGWAPLLGVMAALSMVLGNFAAIAQRGVRRLLAYSAIAHAGYMLLGVMARGPHGMASLIYYATTYGMATIGAFGVVAVVQRDCGDDKLTDFAGLWRRSPALSVCLMIFVLSLAGIPPLAGFFGKFYLFAAIARAGLQPLGMLWLVALAVAMSAVSLYYYLQWLKQVYVVPSAATLTKLRPNPIVTAALIILAASVVILGCAPQIFLSGLQAAGVDLARF